MAWSGHMRRQLTALTMAAALAPVLVACSGGDSPSADSTSTPGSASTSASASSSSASAASCDSLLSQSEAEQAAGTKLGAPQDAGQSGIEACQWSGTTSGVQVLRAPADQWAQQLPQIIGQYETPGAKIPASVKRKLAQGLSRIQAKKPVSADQACGLFAELGKIPGQGNADGTITTVLPSAQKPQAVAAQSCTGGTFAAVTVAFKSLPRSEVSDTESRADAALATVQG